MKLGFIGTGQLQLQSSKAYLSQKLRLGKLIFPQDLKNSLN